MVVYKRSVCPHDCPDTCGLLLGVEKGRVVSVKGDPDHPFTRGAVCAKVKHYGERIYSSLRIHHPLKRVGPKGAGEFERISWDQALDEIVDHYRGIISDFGSEAILPYSYAGTMGVVQFHAGILFFTNWGHPGLKGPSAVRQPRRDFLPAWGISPPPILNPRWIQI